MICLFIAQDGPGGIAGSAGPNVVRNTDSTPISGSMRFDTDDVAGLIADGRYEAVILHEMGVSFFSLRISRIQNLTNRAHYYAYRVVKCSM